MRLGLITAEASGDVLAQHLLKALQPSEVFGSTGHGVACEPVVDHRLNAIGLGALAQVPRALRLLGALEHAFVERRPDVVVTIDGPSFNLRLARRLRSRGIPVVHWVCPQVWAWRPGRIARIAASVDALGCLFPFEVGLFRGTQLRVVFTGHPAAGGPISKRPRALGLAAGSRAGERRRLGGVFADVARAIGGSVVEAVPGEASAVFAEAEAVPGVVSMAPQVDVALCCAGTATLELAVAGVPMVVTYAVDPVSRALGRCLIRVPHVSLPNLILGRGLIAEHLQHLDAHALTAELQRLRGPDGDRQRESLLEVRRLLDAAGAADRMAGLVDDVASRGSTGYGSRGGVQ